MVVVLDSSFFVSLFLETDEHHKKAVGIFEKLATGQTDVLAPTLFFPEVLGTITRVTGDIHFAEIIEETLGKWIENIISVKELTKERMKHSTETAISFRLKGADAVFVSLTKELDASLVTFDGDVKKKIKEKIKLFEI